MFKKKTDAIVSVTKEQVPTEYYRLRWRFDFAGKPSKYGGWNLSSSKKEDMALYVDKKGLVRAAIEGENRITFETKTLFECDGSDYVLCQGEAYAKIPRGIGLTGTVQPRTMLAGISFLTREEKITVLVNGQISKRSLTNDEKKFKFFEHIVGS